MVLGQQAVLQAEQLYKDATALYNNKDFVGQQLCLPKPIKSMLEPTYALNAGLAFYEAKQFEQAIRYLIWS